MIPNLLAINSGLLILTAVFLIIAIGHTILTFTWTMLIYAVFLFFLLLVSEVILSLLS